MDKLLKEFNIAHKAYKKSYFEFKKLDKKSRDKITIELINIESKSSVAIETK